MNEFRKKQLGKMLQGVGDRLPVLITSFEEFEKSFHRGKGYVDRHDSFQSWVMMQLSTLQICIENLEKRL